MMFGWYLGATLRVTLKLRSSCCEGREDGIARRRREREGSERGREGREGEKCEWGERKEWEGGMSREKGGVHVGGGRDEGGTY